MTVSTTSSRVTYAGNGVTTNFAVPFYFLVAADLVVIKTASDGSQTPLVLNTDYTVSGAGVISGGSVTLAVAPATGYTVVIYRDPAVTQTTDYQPNDPFPAETHERALDKLTMITQRLKDLVSRSFRLSDGDTSTASTTLPSPSSNKLIAWNQAATGLQNVDPTTLATIVAFGTANADVFSGTGSQTAFTLSANPGAINNLDVSISGVSQRPGIDYTWTSGTTITFTSAPPSGSNNVLVRYMQGLPQGYTDAGLVPYFDSATYTSGSVGYRLKQLVSSAGASLVGFVQSGTGAITRWVQDKLREQVSVLDFGADPTGTTDSTAAFTAAMNASDRVYAPKGTYLLTNLRYKTGKMIVGDGYQSTILKQASASARVIYALSDATVGQLINIGLSKVGIQGAASATVSAVRLEATSPYAIRNADFDYEAGGCYNSLEIVTTVSNEVYGSKFKVSQTSSLSTGVITKGVYNTYDMFIGASANGFSISDGSWSSTFIRAVSDGMQQYGGQNCMALNPTVEGWTGSAQYAAIVNSGFSNTLINVGIVNVPNSATSGNIGIALNGGGGGRSSILGARIIGTYPATACAYPIDMPAGNSGTISDFQSSCLYKIDAYVSAANLSKFNFVGDCSTLTNRGGYWPEDGTATFAAATTVAVTLATTQPDTNYRVSLGSQANKTFWVSGKTTTGFTLNASASSSDTVEWSLTRS